MNTRNFKCFQVVYEERNLQVAAGKLFLSPQGLSKIIKNLEEEVATPLFFRSKEGFVPTESGKIFYEKSKVIMRDLNDMFQSIEAAEDRERRFEIGFASGSIRAMDISRIQMLMEGNPQILASWHEQENQTVVRQVINHEVGLGFVIGKPSDNQLICHKVKSVDVVLYVYRGHRLWDANEVELKEIKNEPLISMNENYHVYTDVINACHMNGFRPQIVAKVAEGESIHQLVAHRVGIGISPKFFTDDDTVRGIPIQDAYTWDIYGIYRKDTPEKELVDKIMAQA
jgi:DNA-binding transcriptional LysR family regulator